MKRRSSMAQLENMRDASQKELAALELKRTSAKTELVRQVTGFKINHVRQHLCDIDCVVQALAHEQIRPL